MTANAILVPIDLFSLESGREEHFLLQAEDGENSSNLRSMN